MLVVTIGRDPKCHVDIIKKYDGGLWPKLYKPCSHPGNQS